jgi:hypothetical protein
VRVILKVVSGGQAGADRGALEAALELGTPYGGWVPKGRRAEDGKVPACFSQLQEHASEDYQHRTYANVRDSDATVIIAKTPLSGGSKLTLRLCREQERPLKVLDAKSVMENQDSATRVLIAWVRRDQIKVLNVAGSRESGCPGLQAAVKRVVQSVLAQLGMEESGE